jgi:hypothetical protein
VRILTLLTILLVLGAVSWAQTSPMQPAPAPGITAGPQGGMMTNPPSPQPQEGPSRHWRHHHRGVLIVGLILRVIVTLAASFALVALGIFLIRRSTGGPAIRS